MKYSKTFAKNLKRCAYSLFLLQLFLVQPFAQIEQTPAKSNEMQAVENVSRWRLISEQITSDIVDDTRGDYSERPIVLAKLAGLWWKKDNYTSRKWLKEAVSETTYDRINESANERTKRLEIAARLIKFVMPKDKRLGKQLIEFVIENSNQASLNTIIADELVKTAIEIVGEDKDSAKALGTVSLKFGQSYKLYLLIWELNVKEEALAEKLFREVLLSVYANQNSDASVGLMSSLSNLVFRKHKEKSISDRLRKEYLNGLYNLMNSSRFEYRNCQFLGIAINLLTSYENYSPEKVNAIKLKSKYCENIEDSNFALSRSNFNEDEPETVEELISGAKKTNNDVLKAAYYQKAIEKLYYSKQYEEILTILDDMDEKNKAAFGEETWDSWWAESARQACLAFIEAERITDAYRIIGKTPKELRPSVQSGLANEFKETDRAFALQMLNDARKGLEAFEIKPNHKAGLLVYLVKQYAEIAPFETVNVFRDTVKAVNASDDENEENNPVKDFAPMSDSISLPILLLETEEIATLEILSRIGKKSSRIRFRLGLIGQSLKKFDEATIALEKLIKQSNMVNLKQK